MISNVSSRFGILWVSCHYEVLLYLFLLRCTNTLFANISGISADSWRRWCCDILTLVTSFPLNCRRHKLFRSIRLNSTKTLWKKRKKNKILFRIYVFGDKITCIQCCNFTVRITAAEVAPIRLLLELAVLTVKLIFL